MICDINVHNEVIPVPDPDHSLQIHLNKLDILSYQIVYNIRKLLILHNMNNHHHIPKMTYIEHQFLGKHIETAFIVQNTY